MYKIITETSMEKMAGGISGLLTAVENKANAIKKATGVGVPALSKNFSIGKSTGLDLKFNPSKKSAYIGIKRSI